MARPPPSCGRLQLACLAHRRRLDPSDRLPCTSWLWRRLLIAQSIRAEDKSDKPPELRLSTRRGRPLLGQSGPAVGRAHHEKAAGAFESKAISGAILAGRRSRT